jgi:AcrR family transcriptional regulator
MDGRIHFMSTVGGEATREASRDELRGRMVEAARDIVTEEGLDALSMRALGSRVGVSPGTIYLHFQDKDELLRSVMEEGFARLGATVAEETARLPADAPPMDHLACSARGYARFALENTGYFRAMFEVPGVPSVTCCPAPRLGRVSREESLSLLRRAAEEGDLTWADPDRAAVVGWGLIHGLTSLYLSGHLGDEVSSHEEFMELIDSAMGALRAGWKG